MNDNVTVTLPRAYWEQVVKCIDIALAPKPEPKPDVIVYKHITLDSENIPFFYAGFQPNLKITLDGETKELKSAEVIK
mgnify:CR=1 FL=1